MAGSLNLTLPPGAGGCGGGQKPQTEVAGRHSGRFLSCEFGRFHVDDSFAQNLVYETRVDRLVLTVCTDCCMVGGCSSRESSNYVGEGHFN